MSKSKQGWIPAAGTFASLQIAGVAGWNLYTPESIKITCGKCFGVATFNKLKGAVALLQIRHLLTYFLIGAEIKDPLCC